MKRKRVSRKAAKARRSRALNRSDSLALQNIWLFFHNTHNAFLKNFASLRPLRETFFHLNQKQNLPTY